LSQTYTNLAVVYINQEKYDLASSYFDKGLVTLKKLNNQYRLAVTYMNMGKLYTLKGEYPQAEDYLFKAESLAKSINQKRILQEIYKKLTTLEKGRNRFDFALKYSDQAAIYGDSIYTEEKAKQIAEIETRYETEKKDQKIILLEQDRKIQLLWRNIIIASLAVIAAGSIGLYFLHRFRGHKNREILNLKIDYLSAQHSELSLKYKSILTGSSETPTESMDEKLLKKAINTIEDNLADPSFNVEKMAHELGMSRTNMHRKIKAVTGFPPSELIRSIRLRKAAILLANKTDSISQISILVGFEDHSYFSKAFKKQFGTSPSEYIQSNATNAPAVVV
jgi:AraC-like DNA-binding protein